MYIYYINPYMFIGVIYRYLLSSYKCISRCYLFVFFLLIIIIICLQIKLNCSIRINIASRHFGSKI